LSVSSAVTTLTAEETAAKAVPVVLSTTAVSITINAARASEIRPTTPRPRDNKTGTRNGLKRHARFFGTISSPHGTQRTQQGPDLYIGLTKPSRFSHQLTIKK
jgi:hypothetical protein